MQKERVKHLTTFNDYSAKHHTKGGYLLQFAI